MLFASADNGYAGFFAQRWPDSAWKVEEMPMTMAGGDLVIHGSTLGVVAAVYDGALGVSLWRRVDGAWSAITELAGKNYLFAGQLALDRSGVIHIAHMDKTSAIYHRTYDGEWQEHLVVPLSTTDARMGLTSTDSPRVVAWDRAEGPIELLWSAPPTGPEIGSTVNWGSIQRPDFAMLVAPDDSTWLLLNGDVTDADEHQLLLVHRDPAGIWTSEQLATEKLIVNSCGSEPAGPGEACMVERTRVYPRGLLASVDDVRALYLWLRREESYVSTCAPECTWVLQSFDEQSELRLGWPGGSAADHDVVAEDILRPVSVQLDTSGNMHMAFYDQAPGLGAVVRYLMVGP